MITGPRIDADMVPRCMSVKASVKLVRVVTVVAVTNGLEKGAEQNMACIDSELNTNVKIDHWSIDHTRSTELQGKLCPHC